MLSSQMKRAVAYSEGVGLIAGLAHLPPVERPFAWLGSGPLRPSDAAGGLLDRLQRGGGGGDDDGRSAMQLQILKVRGGGGGRHLVLLGICRSCRSLPMGIQSAIPGCPSSA